MPSLETPEVFLPLRSFTTAGGGCATLSGQEGFWFAQPSLQGWLGLLHVCMMDRIIIGKQFWGEGQCIGHVALQTTREVKLIPGDGIRLHPA